VQDRPDGRKNASYDTDFYAWCHEQARLMREGRLGELDVENVAEELESMGRSDKHQIRSRLKVLITHLLKWRYQPGRRSTSWQRTIRDQREELAYIASESPSLKGYASTILPAVYASARHAASIETGIDYSVFPDACPFSADQVADLDFLPIEPEGDDQG